MIGAGEEAVTAAPRAKLRPVLPEAVGAAEWPIELASAAAASSALCDSGALLAARFVPTNAGGSKGGRRAARGMPRGLFARGAALEGDRRR